MQTKRKFLLGCVAAPLLFTGCATVTSVQSAITVTEDAFTYAKAIISAINAVLGDTGISSAVASVASKITAWIGDATSLLSNLNVGSFVSPTTTAGVLTDLSSALTAVASLLPGNEYILAAQVVLASLKALWAGAATTPAFAARAVGTTLPQALSTLSVLPPPVLLAGK